MEKTKKSSRGRTPEGNPNPVDIHVGNRIRLRRQQLGLSQEKLAELLGLTFQQVQKYERGMNRVGASRLWDISKVLEVDIGYCYADMSPEVAQSSPRKLSAVQTDLADFLEEPTLYDPMQDSKNIEMITSFHKIKNPKIKKHIQELIKESSRIYLGEEENNEREAAE